MEQHEKRAQHWEEAAEFDVVDAGASHTVSVQAGHIRKGDHIMIKQRPCRVTEVDTSQPGKHGGTKSHFVAIDLFTGKKMETLCPAKADTDVPIVKKKDYQVMYVNDEGFLPLLCLQTCKIRSDLRLPDDRAVADRIVKLLDDDNDVLVSVVSACGEEKIVDAKMLAPG